MRYRERSHNWRHVSICACKNEHVSLGWVEYKTQTTVPLADGPLAAALWGRAMDLEGRNEGEGTEAIAAYRVLPRY